MTMNPDQYGTSYDSSQELVPGSLRAFRHFKVDAEGLLDYSGKIEPKPRTYRLEPMGSHVNSWEVGKSTASCNIKLDAIKFVVSDRDYQEMQHFRRYPDSESFNSDYGHLRPYESYTFHDYIDGDLSEEPCMSDFDTVSLSREEILNYNVSSYNFFIGLTGGFKRPFVDVDTSDYGIIGGGWGDPLYPSYIERRYSIVSPQSIITYKEWRKARQKAVDVHGKRSPFGKCSCGFYASYSPHTDFYGRSVYPTMVSRTYRLRLFASVRMWGRVVMGSKGVRAEYAEVEALCPEVYGWDAPVVEKVAEIYGVPWFEDKAYLLEKFPQEDVSALLDT